MMGDLGVEIIEQVVHRELVALIVVDDGEDRTCRKVQPRPTNSKGKCCLVFNKRTFDIYFSI